MRLKQTSTLALQRHMRHHRFVVHLDVRRYFPSIDLDILRGRLRRRIRDRAFLAVIDLVLESGAGLLDQPGVRACLGVPSDWPERGLPVGALTSQFLAMHVYQTGSDHHITRGLRVPGYVRYVDDLFLFGDSRAELRRWREQIGAWRLAERGLRLKHPDARLLSCAGRLDGLGYRICRHQIRVSERTIHRLRGRVQAWLEAPESRELRVHIQRSVAGSLGALLG